MDENKKQKIINIIKDISESLPISHMAFGIVSHPLIESSRVFLNKNQTMVFVNDDTKKDILQERYELLHKCDNVHSIIYRVNKPYRLQMLVFISHLLDGKEFNELFRGIWTSTEYPNHNNAKDLVDLFKRVNSKLIMTAEEFSFWQDLPDTIVVYRGLQGAKAKLRAYSWTFDKDKAYWFANRFHRKGKIYQAEISKEAIYFYTDLRNEKEIVLNPRKLKNIQEIIVEKEISTAK